jgi:AbrB family looped-hinge helix DNA binding protein
MTIQTKVSAKGQIVIPKDVRDRLSWDKGTPLEVVAGECGVFLRAVPKPSAESFDAFTKRIRKIVNYKGKRVSDDDAKEAVDKMFREDPQWDPQR